MVSKFPMWNLVNCNNRSNENGSNAVKKSTFLSIFFLKKCVADLVEDYRIISIVVHYPIMLNYKKMNLEKFS